jgi:hypothetical protein
MARKKANSLTQSELNDLLLAAIVVQERITSCMLSLWLTAIPTDEEYRARLGAIRSSALTGLNGLPQGFSERATLLLRETIDQIDTEIRKARTSIVPSPGRLQ